MYTPEQSEYKIIDNTGHILPKAKKHWSDRIECPVCRVFYTRSNATSHKRSKKHQLFQKVVDKLLGVVHLQVSRS